MPRISPYKVHPDDSKEQWVGNDYFSEGMYREAIKEYVRLLNTSRDSVDTDWGKMGNVRRLKRFHLQLRIKIVESSLKIRNVSMAVQHYRLAVPLARSESFRDVTELLNATLNLNEGEQVKNILFGSLKAEFDREAVKARGHISVKEYSQAITSYDRLAQFIRDSETNSLYMGYIDVAMVVRVYANLAVCHANTEEFGKAIAEYDQAIRRLPDPRVTKRYEKQRQQLVAARDRCGQIVRNRQLLRDAYNKRVESEKVLAEIDRQRHSDRRRRREEAEIANQALRERQELCDKRRREQEEEIERIYGCIQSGSFENEIVPQNLELDLGQLVWFAQYWRSSKSLRDKAITLILHYHDDESIERLIDECLERGTRLAIPTQPKYNLTYGDRLLIDKIAERHDVTRDKVAEWKEFNDDVTREKVAEREAFNQSPFRDIAWLFLRSSGSSVIFRPIQTSWWYDRVLTQQVVTFLSHKQLQNGAKIDPDDLHFIDSLDPIEAYLTVGSGDQVFCYKFASHIILFRLYKGIYKDIFIIEGTGEWQEFVEGMPSRMLAIEGSRVFHIEHGSWKQELENHLSIQGYEKPTPDQYILDWEVLPPGCFEDDRQLYMLEQKLNLGLPYDSTTRDMERLRFIDSLSPSSKYVGGNLLSGRSYTVFVFDEHVVADCPYEGNAIYVINGTDGWRELLKGSKAELQRIGGSRVRRIIHTGTWHNRLIDAINA